MGQSKQKKQRAKGKDAKGYNDIAGCMYDETIRASAWEMIPTGEDIMFLREMIPCITYGGDPIEHLILLTPGGSCGILVPDIHAGAVNALLESLYHGTPVVEFVTKLRDRSYDMNL